MKAAQQLKGVNHEWVEQKDHILLAEGSETNMRSWVIRKIKKWHQGPVSGLRQRHAFFHLKEGKMSVVLRQAVHLKTGISHFMNAGFCNYKCCLVLFWCIISFVYVIVVLKDPRHG